jgi:hypothetical protein
MFPHFLRLRLSCHTRRIQVANTKAASISEAGTEISEAFLEACQSLFPAHVLEAGSAVQHGFSPAGWFAYGAKPVHGGLTSQTSESEAEKRVVNACTIPWCICFATARFVSNPEQTP